MTNITFNGTPLTREIIRSCLDALTEDLEHFVFIEDDDFDEETDRSLREWLADPANRTKPEYSDIFKDVHGFRPHFE